MPLQLAIVYPGNSEARLAATPHNNRFAALFAAFGKRGVQVQPAVYNDQVVDEVLAQLLPMDGALVWVNPIEAGRSRDTLDAMLRSAAAAGVVVSTHPEVILKLGTKDVLVETRDLGWGSDCHRIDSLAQLRAELPARLAGGAARVLKQWRGHSGIGVWRVQSPSDQAPPGPLSLVRARHAQRGSVEELITFDAFVSRMAVYFEHGGHMVDQVWQPRLTEGMVRCYLVQDRVVGFGLQAVNALYPSRDDRAPEDAPAPGPRLYHPPNLAQAQGLRLQLELEWMPQLQQALSLSRDDLPLLWDCDFLFADSADGAADRYALCEINVSSVAPFPDSAIEPLVTATIARLEAGRAHRLSLAPCPPCPSASSA